MYCEENNAFRQSLMEKLCELPYATVYLFKDQRYYGRCVVAFRGYHAAELYELKPEHLSGYATDVAKTAQAVRKVSNAAKVNYAIYGDLAQHVHVHVVPKQENGEDWGGPFRMDGEPKFLSAEEWIKLRKALLNELL